MFDIGWMELLVIAVVAIVVVGPKDLPRLMRTFGHYAGKVRRMASDFQTQFDQAMTDAELEEMQRRYQEAVEMPERIKGPPMLPVPEEARAHPQNQPKAAGAAATKHRTAPAKPAAKNSKSSTRSSTSRRKPVSKAASQKAAPTGTSNTGTGSKSAAARKAPAKAASSKSAATPAPAAPKAPPKPGGAKRAASKTAKPRGGAKPGSARKSSGSKEQSS
jgi:sec-independent protein translocase protein TatB